MTEEDNLRARALLIEAALDLTRMKGRMRWACRMVLLNGRTMQQAATRTGQKRQNVYKALLRARAKLALVQNEADKLKSGG